MTARNKGVVVAGAGGVALAAFAMALSRHLGASGGAMIIGAIVMQFISLGLLARDRRERAQLLAVAPANSSRR